MSKPATLIVAAVAVVLAFVLNPSPDRHREKIKAAIAERSQLEKMLGIGQLTSKGTWLELDSLRPPHLDKRGKSGQAGREKASPWASNR